MVIEILVIMFSMQLTHSKKDLFEKSDTSLQVGGGKLFVIMSQLSLF